MHVFAENVQRIRDTSRQEEVLAPAEVDNADFDVIFLSESWRGDSDETFLTAKQHKISLSGGLHSKGVGISFSRLLNHLDDHVVFATRLFATAKKGSGSHFREHPAGLSGWV